MSIRGIIKIILSRSFLLLIERMIKMPQKVLHKDIRKLLRESKRIVIKAGTSTLTHGDGKVKTSVINRLTKIISSLADEGKELVLVTSGAIGIGTGILNLPSTPKDTADKQATAAVGQGQLMHIYSKSFAKHNKIVAQILLTKDITDDERSRKNVVNTFKSLLNKQVIPIVNENDTVSVEEIEQVRTFGDNDRLSALVAKLINADLLILLSDIDGLYDRDPRHTQDSKLISFVDNITEDIESSAGGAGTSRGKGGMATKIMAAKVATEAGVNMVIARGDKPEIITDIMNGKEVGTLFCAHKVRGKING